MKKVVFLACTAFLMQSLSVAWAAERGTPEYKRLVEYKKAQREKRAQCCTDAPAEKGFWQREAERSGLAGTAAMLGNAAASVVPLDKPNSRKQPKT